MYFHNKPKKVKELKKKDYPNFFIRRDLGGLGLRPVGPFKVSLVQRRVASYFSAHRDELFLREKTSDLPQSAKQAIRKYNILRSDPVDFCDEKGRSYFGPLRQGEDYDEYASELLRKCLVSTQFCAGQPRKRDYLPESRFYFRALKSSSTCMKEKKIKNYTPHLRLTPNFQPSITWSKIHSTRHWTSDYQDVGSAFQNNREIRNIKKEKKVLNIPDPRLGSEAYWNHEDISESDDDVSDVMSVEDVCLTESPSCRFLYEPPSVYQPDSVDLLRTLPIELTSLPDFDPNMPYFENGFSYIPGRDFFCLPEDNIDHDYVWDLPSDQDNWSDHEDIDRDYDPYHH